MKLSLILILQVTNLLSPSILFANNIFSDSSLLKITASPTHSASKDIENLSSKIKICSQDSNNEICSEFPKISSLIFKGTLEDWDYFFNRCSGINDVNTLHDLTLLALPWLLLPSFGFWKTIAIELGIGFVSWPVYSFEEPEKIAIEKSKKMVLYILKNKNKQINADSKHLIALQNVLNTCSTAFNQDYKSHLASECLSGCHGQKNNTRPEVSQIPSFPKPDSYRSLNDPMRTLNPHSREGRQEIIDYLNSIKQQTESNDPMRALNPHSREGRQKIIDYLNSIEQLESNESERSHPNEIEQNLVY